MTRPSNKTGKLSNEEYEELDVLRMAINENLASVHPE